MNFLVDAQLPQRLANQLRAVGHDVVHTLDLPNRNRTTDDEINRIAEREQRIVVTKDADFVNSFPLAILRTPISKNYSLRTFPQLNLAFPLTLISN